MLIAQHATIYRGATYKVSVTLCQTVTMLRFLMQVVLRYRDQQSLSLWKMWKISHQESECFLLYSVVYQCPYLLALCRAVLLYYMLISSSVISCSSYIFRHCVMLCYLYLHAYVFMLHDLKALWHAVLQVSACIASWCVTLTSRHCIMLCFMHLLEFVLMCHRYLLALCQLSCSVARISRHCHAVSHTSSDIILLCYMYLQALCHVSCVLSILSCRMYF